MEAEVRSPKSEVRRAKAEVRKPRAGAIQKHGSVAGSPGRMVSYANRWRENYNPLRQLSIAMAVSLLERGQRGDMALLQWTFRFVERRYATLAAVLSRCESPLLNFDWEIKIKEELPAVETGESIVGGVDNGEAKTGDGTDGRDGKDANLFEEMAKRQQATLKAAYEGVDNLTDAIQHLHLAEFRGYSHLQKHRDDQGNVVHLETLDQWCVCRDGLYGDWWWNPDSRSMTMPALVLPEDHHIGGAELPIDDFIIREVSRPIDEIGLVNFIRANLCEKDWDGFIEIYGIPGGVVVMPPNVPQGKEAEYESAAQQVAEGGSGAIPNGAAYEANDGPRGIDPFSPRLKHLDEQVVLAGTGGKLTMLAESGSGTLAGGAHEDTFDEIAAGRAAKISERFQRDFDAEVLARKHPGEPVLVYFKFGTPDADSAETTGFKRDIVKALAGHEILSRVIANQADLKETVRGAGLAVNEEYTDPYVPVAETSGAMVTGEVVRDADGDIVGGKTEGGTTEPSNLEPRTSNFEKGNGETTDGKDGKDGNDGNGNMRNRDGAPDLALERNGKRLVVEAIQAEFEHLNDRLFGIAEITDAETQKRKLAEVLAELDRFERDLAKDPAVAQAIYKVLAAGMANGMANQG